MTYSNADRNSILDETPADPPEPDGKEAAFPHLGHFHFSQGQASADKNRIEDNYHEAGLSDCYSKRVLIKPGS